MFDNCDSLIEFTEKQKTETIKRDVHIVYKDDHRIFLIII